VSIACGAMPLLAFAVRDCDKYQGCDEATVWLFASLVFVVSFCRIMFSVKTTVGAEDMQRLLTDTVPILTTGVTTANIIFLLLRCPAQTITTALSRTLTSTLLLVLLRSSGASDLQSKALSLSAVVLQCLVLGHGIAVTSSATIAVCVSCDLELFSGSKPTPSLAFGVIVRAGVLCLCSLHYLHQ